MKKLKPEERTWSTARRVVIDIRMFHIFLGRVWKSRALKMFLALSGTAAPCGPASQPSGHTSLPRFFFTVSMISLK